MSIRSITDFAENSGFVRVTGVNSSYHNDILALDEACRRNTIFYQRLDCLPKIGFDTSAFYQNAYDSYIKSGQTTLTTKIANQTSNTMPFFLKAIRSLEHLYSKISGVSDSIVRNAVIQALYRLDCIFDCSDTERKISLKKKIVIADVTARNDYLFACMLSNIGCDVMLLQYRKDISQDFSRFGSSQPLCIGSFSTTPPPLFQNYQNNQNTSQRNSLPTVTGSPYQNIITQSNTQTSTQNSSPVIVIPKHPKRNSAPPPPPTRQSNPYRVSPQPPLNHTARTEKTYEELAQLASSVVLIVINDRKGNAVGSGSGVMIGKKGFILTNKHVIKAGAYYSVRIENDNTVYETDEIIKYNTVTDMAIIRIDRQLTPLPVYQGGKKLVRGQKVVAIGSPLGLFNSVSDGIISGMRKIDDIEMIQFTAPISHGSSGGAVLNMYGELIGLSTAGLDEGQNLNLAVGYEYILPFTRGFI